MGKRSTKNQLIFVVQALSLARDLNTVMEIVRNAGRALTGADGASFIVERESPPEAALVIFLPYR